MHAHYRWIVFAAGLAALPLSVPARSAEAPHAEEHSETLRDFSLRNETDHTIVEAHAFTTKGKEIALTKAGSIRPRLSQNFMFEQSECLDRIEVKFENGKTMSRDKLNDCKDPRLVARAEGITVETGAGGPTHPDASSRNNQGATTR